MEKLGFLAAPSPYHSVSVQRRYSARLCTVSCVSCSSHQSFCSQPLPSTVLTHPTSRFIFLFFFCAVCIFRMALPFENMPLEARRVERERQRHLVFALSCTDTTADCLASMASDHLDRHFRLEDALLAAGIPEVPHAECPEAFLAAIRVAIPELTCHFGQLYTAARYGCSTVGDALHVDEEVPGLSGVQLKAISANHLPEEQARTARPVAATPPDRRRTMRNLASARATVTAMETASVAAAPAPPALTFDSRQVYCCYSCNQLGHWAQDNKCKPADVQANLARLTTLLEPPPPPAGAALTASATGLVAGSSTGRLNSRLIFIFHSRVFYPR